MTRDHAIPSARARVLALATALLIVAGCSGAAGSDRAADSSPTTIPAVAASAGCGTLPSVTATDDPLGDVPLELGSGGRTRHYRLGVPASYDPNTPSPVILDLHGAVSNAQQQSTVSQLPAKGTARGYLVVSPDAINGSWELTADGADDTFLMALLDDVAQRYCVDLDRVHAAGISLGSWKATVTACTHQDRFASIALVAEEVAPPGCSLPVVAFHGTADRVVPYGAGADPGVVVTGSNAGLPGVEVNMPKWATNDGCSEEKDVVHLDPDVDHWIYRDCPEGTGVELYSIVGGGHAWPGSPIGGVGVTRTIDATAIALDWFDAHPRAPLGD